MPPPPVILCAVDGTDRARRGVAASRWLAEGLGVSVVLAHVFDPMHVAVPPAGELARTARTTDDVLRLERERARRRLAVDAGPLEGVEYVTELAEGRPVRELLRLAAEHDARLLVTGTAARTSLRRILIGSVSSELATKAPCPVVAVPPGAELEQPGPVLVGYDGSDHSVRAARHGAGLAARLGRELVLMHVVERGEEGVRADAELAGELFGAARACLDDLSPGRALDLTVNVAVEHGEPVERLAQAAHEHSAPLVVVGARGRGAVTAAVLGSVSAGLVAAAQRPVALVTPSADAVLPAAG